MYKKFNLSSVTKDTSKNTIELKFNFDIDADSIGTDTIGLTTSNGSRVDFDIKVVDDIIVLTLQTWPDPEDTLQLLIKKEIKSIDGRLINNALRYKITFESEITSQVIIKKPYNFQKLEDIKCILNDSDNINSYCIQIAKENRFYNFVYDSVIYSNELSIIIPELKAGQYYLRARVQENGKYGKWCQPITFIYKSVCDEDKPKEDGPSANASMPSAWSDLYGNGSTYDTVSDSNTIIDDNLPEVEDELEIITYPEQGVTPSAFVFELDKELDNNFGEIIIIKREF